MIDRVPIIPCAKASSTQLRIIRQGGTSEILRKNKPKATYNIQFFL
jgi:hypothetical protein